MTDTNEQVAIAVPMSDVDKLTQDVAHLKQELARVNARTRETDVLILKLLQVIKKGEETFDVRVARSLYNVFNGVTHNLEHSIEAYTNQIKDAQRGFNVELVDGQTVTENAESIVVYKREDGTYDYAKASDPDTIMNEGTEPFTAYFEDHPEVFGDRKELLINITTSAPAPTKESVDV